MVQVVKNGMGNGLLQDYRLFCDKKPHLFCSRCQQIKFLLVVNGPSSL